MKIFDIGANLVDDMFSGIYHGVTHHAPDLEAVLSRSAHAGVTNILLTSSCVQDFYRNCKIIQSAVERSKIRLWTTLGVHPCQAQSHASDLEQLYNILLHPPSSLLRSDSTAVSEPYNYIKAFGECGLDYDRLHYAAKDEQLTVFKEQLQLWSTHCPRLPLFLHMRNAVDDFCACLQEHFNKDNRQSDQVTSLVVHSFTDTWQTASRLLNLFNNTTSPGKCVVYLGFNGCSLKSESTLEAIRECPLDRMLIDSDAPWCEIRQNSPGGQFIPSKYLKTRAINEKEQGLDWLPPKPLDKKRYDPSSSADRREHSVKGRNEPWSCKILLETLATIRGCDPEQLARKVYQNSCQLFYGSDADDDDGGSDHDQKVGRKGGETNKQ